MKTEQAIENDYLKPFQKFLTNLFLANQTAYLQLIKAKKNNWYYSQNVADNFAAYEAAVNKASVSHKLDDIKAAYKIQSATFRHLQDEITTVAPADYITALQFATTSRNLSWGLFLVNPKAWNIAQPPDETHIEKLSTHQTASADERVGAFAELCRRGDMMEILNDHAKIRLSLFGKPHNTLSAIYELIEDYHKTQGNELPRPTAKPAAFFQESAAVHPSVLSHDIVVANINTMLVTLATPATTVGAAEDKTDTVLKDAIYTYQHAIWAAQAEARGDRKLEAKLKRASDDISTIEGYYQNGTFRKQWKAIADNVNKYQLPCGVEFVREVNKAFATYDNINGVAREADSSVVQKIKTELQSYQKELKAARMPDKEAIVKELLSNIDKGGLTAFKANWQFQEEKLKSDDKPKSRLG